MYEQFDISDISISGYINEQDKEMLTQHFQEAVSVVNDSITAEMQ